MSGEAPARRWVLLLQSGDSGRLAEAAAMAAAAVSLGTDVTLVWLSGAVDLLVSGRLEAESGEPGSAAHLFAEARETGRVRLLACSAAMVKSRTPPERLRERVDEIVGWPTVISLIRSSERSFLW
jgi:predicted peroxiredoxin